MSHPPDRFSTRFGAHVGLMCVALFALSAHAQSVWQSSVVPAQTMQGAVLVLPDSSALSEQVAGSPDTRVSIAVEGDYRVYRARHKGKDHHMHVALDSNQAPRIAFDLEEGRFRNILPSLRIEMNDYADFDSIVQQAGGSGGKVYEALGFALIHLPDDINPAEVAAGLGAVPGVTRAIIQLQGPLHVPM